MAALLISLHPWHISHSVEARGYSFIFLLGIAVLFFGYRALQTGSWRWWLLLGLGQFLLLYTYPGALFILVPFTLVMMGLIWRQNG